MFTTQSMKYIWYSPQKIRLYFLYLIGKLCHKARYGKRIWKQFCKGKIKIVYDDMESAHCFSVVAEKRM